ncbi:glycosyltransferase family 9 protein, partial [Candidatus Aminicenantes bacterium AC-335-K20]|nr:glycosyltransferase family 9 protein [Candidatus Aminicenantes bacterium AC-335-K20]
KIRIGFHKKNLKEPLASLFYNYQLPEIQENLHVIRKNIKLLNLLNINEEKIEFPIEISQDFIYSVERKLMSCGYDFKKKLILLNIGAGWETKRWDIRNFIKLAKMLKRDDRFILYLWGNSIEEKLALEACKETGIPMLPFLTISELMGLISRATILVSGDSFPLHFASAILIPVVGIFGPTDPERNGPIRSHDEIVFHKLTCSFCYKRKCDSMECIKKISPNEVYEKVIKILNGN